MLCVCDIMENEQTVYLTFLRRIQFVICKFYKYENFFSSSSGLVFWNIKLTLPKKSALAKGKGSCLNTKFKVIKPVWLSKYTLTLCWVFIVILNIVSSGSIAIKSINLEWSMHVFHTNYEEFSPFSTCLHIKPFTLSFKWFWVLWMSALFQSRSWIEVSVWPVSDFILTCKHLFLLSSSISSLSWGSVRTPGIKISN